MLSRIREIFRSEYIGAIVIGYLTAVAMMGVVAVVMSPLTFKLLNANHSYRRALGSEPAAFDWDSLVVSVVKIALQLGVAYLLLKWVYPWQEPDATRSTEGGDDAVA
jgi:hypothetical protein